MQGSAHSPGKGSPWQGGVDGTSKRAAPMRSLLQGTPGPLHQLLAESTDDAVPLLDPLQRHQGYSGDVSLVEEAIPSDAEDRSDPARNQARHRALQGCVSSSLERFCLSLNVSLPHCKNSIACQSPLHE